MCDIQKWWPRVELLIWGHFSLCDLQWKVKDLIQMYAGMQIQLIILILNTKTNKMEQQLDYYQ